VGGRDSSRAVMSAHRTDMTRLSPLFNVLAGLGVAGELRPVVADDHHYLG
jgi:hypothetical protein